MVVTSCLNTEEGQGDEQRSRDGNRNVLNVVIDTRICILIIILSLSIRKVLLDVSKLDAHSVTYFGGPRPRALGLDRAFGLSREFGSVMGAQGKRAGSKNEASEGLSLGLV
jgi:hypothetical protein